MVGSAPKDRWPAQAAFAADFRLMHDHPRLAVVGDIGGFFADGEALRDWVVESNRGRHVCFVKDVAAPGARLAWPPAIHAIPRLSRQLLQDRRQGQGGEVGQGADDQDHADQQAREQAVVCRHGPW